MASTNMQPTEALVPIRQVAVTLHHVEEDLAALLDTEALVTPEDQEGFQLTLAKALTAVVEKRDRVAEFLMHLDSQMLLADAQIGRIQQRRETFEKAKALLESYVVETIKALGADEKGRFRKLEGRTSTLSIRRNPPSTEIENEAAVPLEFKDANIAARCPADRWTAAIEELRGLWVLSVESAALSDDAKQVMALLLDPKNVKHTVRKTDVKKAIDAGQTVPGADVSTGSLRLVVK